MTNFVFISPHFPTNYWQFCRALKDTGVNVLGIADMPYDQLPAHVQGALTDYYHVPSLEDGDAVLKAVGWFTHRWGKIDWLESNNEYWLEQDAWLRTMFHITTGPQMEQMELYKRKSAMKEGYRRAGVPVAKWRLADTLAQAQAFAEQVGYPIVAKPDTGVGASNMYRIQDENDLRAFFAKKPLIPYILEQYVNGGICSYDALIDSQGNPLYETGNLTSGSLMDVVNHQLDSVFMIVPEVAEDLREIGRRTVKAFNVKS
ncbi:MAG: carbamoylphosphate synthase large subunit, partial [Clostridiales bacterium]|nr:carbamoylphosphate synthase large subunit [Clostridiales bacterium]